MHFDRDVFVETTCQFTVAESTICYSLLNLKTHGTWGAGSKNTSIGFNSA